MGKKYFTKFFRVKIHENLSALLESLRAYGRTNFNMRVLPIKIVLAYLTCVESYSTNY
jgi:hypothetical protein